MRNAGLRLLVVALLIVVTTGVQRAQPATAAPAFNGTVEMLSREVRNRMIGSSWHSGCPVALSDLRLLRMNFYGWDGQVYRGRMVVNRWQAQRVLRIFGDLYEARFRIRRMYLVDAYDGSDDRSMAANNTSAFNCRRVAGTSRWSEHAYGRAIDINPVQNPYVNGSTVEPEAGRSDLDRSDVRKGMVVRPGPVVRAFADEGWLWGGDWNSSKDYQHFSQTGR